MGAREKEKIGSRSKEGKRKKWRGAEHARTSISMFWNMQEMEEKQLKHRRTGEKNDSIVREKQEREKERVLCVCEREEES